MTCSIEQTSSEIPGLMAFRVEVGSSQPLKGAKITGSLPITTQTAALVQTLVALGAQCRWCSCNVSPTQEDVAAAAIAGDSAAVFACKGESTTLQEYWRCTEAALDWGPDDGGPDLIVDGSGDVTLLIHEGVKAEEVYKKTGRLPPNPASNSIIDNAKLEMVWNIVRDGLKTNPNKYTRMIERVVGVIVTEGETSTGVVDMLYQLQANGTLLFPAFNVDNHSMITKSKFANYYSHQVLDDLIRASDGDAMIAGKVAVVCGYGDVGKGCAASLKQAGARVIVADDINLINNALEASLVLTTTGLDEDVVSEADIFVIAAANNKDIIIKIDHMKKMKNNAIVYNIDNTNAIDMYGLENYPGIKRIPIKPQIDRWVFPENETGIVVVLGEEEGRIMTSCSVTRQVMAQLELWKEKGSGKYENKVYVLPQHLDDKVAALHLGANLTITKEDQPQYSYNPAHYSIHGAPHGWKDQSPSSSSTTTKKDKKAKGFNIAAATKQLRKYSKKLKKEKKKLKKLKKNYKRELKEWMDKGVAKEAELNEMKSKVAQMGAQCHLEQQVVNYMLPFFL